MRREKKRAWMMAVWTLAATVFFLGCKSAFSADNPRRGQSVYVPLYSNIYYGDREKPFELTATLSIRNTDTKKEITLISVDYFDSNGNFLKQYVKEPVKLNKLASTRYIIKSKDNSGGSGAKFIVRWQSSESVNPPLIEAIMISTKSGQGISFVSRGLSIKE